MNLLQYIDIKDNLRDLYLKPIMRPSQKKTIANKYQILLSQPLGSGTFATTYLCRLKSNQSIILACKLMNKKQISKLVPDLEYLMKRVKDQLNAWKQLEHQNIVKFQACEQTVNNIYFFLEYCPDGTLEQYIQSNKIKVKEVQVKRWMKQLVSACVYLEGKNIVHRDIKPANILLKGSQLKLGDFGLARVIQTDDQKGKKSFFTFAGTLHYMAPQIIQLQKYPYKCDVWSVGVTIFMMFVGKLPFNLQNKDNSEAVILNKIKSNKQEYKYAIFQKNPQVVKILQLMLNPDSSHRAKMSQIWKYMESVGFGDQEK